MEQVRTYLETILLIPGQYHSLARVLEMVDYTNLIATNKHTGNASDAASKHATSHANTEDGRINGERRSAAGPLTGNSKSVQASSLGLNQPCNILSWIDTDEMVAKGRVSAVDPSSKVHGYVLGPGCYRIEVEEAVNPRPEFYLFQPEFSVM